MGRLLSARHLEKSMLSIIRPMLVVVLKGWVTEMKETPRCASISSTSLANRQVRRSADRPADDDHVYPSGLDMVQQLLKGGPIDRKAPSSYIRG